MKVEGVEHRTVFFDGRCADLIDQRLLPHRFERIQLDTVESVARAIEQMAVRGAGAIGATAAAGLAVAAVRGESLPDAAERLARTRPTAQNLFWALNRVLAADDPIEEAMRIGDEDAAACEAIGRHGAALIEDGMRVATHCNAGWLAFVDWGSALAPIYAAHRQGKRVEVWVDETRPRGQGARLTAWELAGEGVPHTVIPDNALASRMAAGQVDLVLTGADRIAANGDVANKIGTYAVAVLARHHAIPFYVCAPRSTFDADTPDGAGIPIEERSADEVAWTTGATAAGEITRVRTTLSPVRNWAFDVTPHALITGVVSEDGVRVHG